MSDVRRVDIVGALKRAFKGALPLFEDASIRKGPTTIDSLPVSRLVIAGIIICE